MNQERKRILELVQDGKLSAQEAIILLEALEKELVKETSSVEETKQNKADFNEPVSSMKEKTDEKESTSENMKEEQNKQDKKEDSFYSQLENAGERIFDFVNHAFQKIKDIDLQFTQSVDVAHTFQQSGTEVEKIDIDVANGPVRIVSWDQEDVRIECQAKVYRQDDRESARNYFIDNTIFSIENDLLIFSTQSKWMKVETVVYIPKKQYKKISSRIFHGGLTGDHLQADFLSIKTTNGKVEFSHIEGKQFHIDTVNGQIKLEHSQADKIEAETVNGSIDVSGFYQEVELQSFNGNVTCIVPEIGTKRIETKVVTGNISINLPRSSSIDGDVRSNLGSYKLELDDVTVMHEKREIIQKQMTFKRTGIDDRVIHLLADTKTGSVHVTEPESKSE